MEDVNPESRLLHIRESKFFKSRFVPLADSSLSALEEYRVRRPDAKPDSPFFVNTRGRRCNYITVNETFLALSRQLGFKTIQGRDPRLHDFRHTFATRYLSRIYQAGKDPGAALPLLATYLGHANITSTQTYLHPDFTLLEQSGQRFHGYAQGGAYEGH